jgi:hypothetical protein
MEESPFIQIAEYCRAIRIRALRHRSGCRSKAQEELPWTMLLETCAQYQLYSSILKDEASRSTAHEVTKMPNFQSSGPQYEQEARIFTTLENQDSETDLSSATGEQLVLREVIAGPLSTVTKGELAMR